jgi:hypothetical protein
VLVLVQLCVDPVQLGFSIMTQTPARHVSGALQDSLHQVARQFVHLARQDWLI